MDVYILRHGKAGKWVDDSGDDRERPLTPKGRRDIRRISRRIAKTGVELEWIASSPVTRAIETADIVAEEFGVQEIPEIWETLDIGREPEVVIEEISQKDSDSSGMIVGHEPQLTEIISLLVITGGSVRVALAKGGIAKIAEVYFNPEPLGTLEWLISPKLIVRN